MVAVVVREAVNAKLSTYVQFYPDSTDSIVVEYFPFLKHYSK